MIETRYDFQVNGTSFYLTVCNSFQGKGTITTYFLVGFKGFNKPLPCLDRAASESEHTFK